jgi:hypothetical protein
MPMFVFIVPYSRPLPACKEYCCAGRGSYNFIPPIARSPRPRTTWLIQSLIPSPCRLQGSCYCWAFSIVCLLVEPDVRLDPSTPPSAIPDYREACRPVIEPRPVRMAVRTPALSTRAIKTRPVRRDARGVAGRQGRGSGRRLRVPQQVRGNERDVDSEDGGHVAGGEQDGE